MHRAVEPTNSQPWLVMFASWVGSQSSWLDSLVVISYPQLKLVTKFGNLNSIKLESCGIIEECP